jgi:gliding motility-associated-like protein
VGTTTAGTISMNSTTGVYSFTPAPGFTGTTQVSYTLCNILSPPCSTTSITFTVFPALVANPDVITTTANTPTTGVLLTNDAGIASGGIYTVSVTQPSVSVGAITVNPSTGQYTFVPNPAFTGTSSTTYTICNTAVTPSVCSTTSILIQVGDVPMAMPDFTTTMQNIPVTGNASANDTGTLTVFNPVFTTGQPTAGSGILVMNPATGQYTYTPALGFTGTTSATYTLCNLLSPPCATTTITFTVYPNLVANPNVITTTPSVSVNGNLLTNDAGVVVGGTYSVSVTQPAATTGTIVLNPATGQYTFNPNPAFTGSTTTTYTVCNTGVNPSVCSVTTITITVNNLPSAVADATTTPINTPVTGNVSTNDNGASVGFNPTFTNSQPTAGTGTLTMNPTTGQYTFTPASGFTGTTIATYTLCNLNSPPCSTTTITFTVYPNIVANPDVISTTPSVSATGNVLTNDNGIVSGATYSVSVTQLSPSTGTITMNPATGQYTFTPNPTFTGSTTTTYTVCNTSVNPVICSVSTITINVNNSPVAVADGTSTPINTPVSGNVSTNDIGGSAAFNPTFTNSQPTAGTGTLTMNPTTGQYTFTPAPGFTGTTSATYTLCNLTSPPCSTTTITFTVNPALLANPDLIVTTPSVSVSGNLLTNDTGVLPTGVYSVTVTQPAPTTGTIVYNSATGQYTFVPNPGFVGVVQTTYTVCNITLVGVVCSVSTITIQVGDFPLAVPDGTATVVNTSVTGSVGGNDAGTLPSLNPTFTNGQPTAGTGTLTMNPTTGQYTFTPAPGFTGTTTATYTLCNILSPPCSTTTITFTVYPSLQANPDVIATTPSVSVTGTLTTNDLGVLPGGTYSVSVTQPSPSTGTILINPATGQYTFVPNPSFTGTAQTTYTICNTSVNPIVCSNSTITIYVGNSFVPKIGVAKWASKVESEGGGCSRVTFKFTIKNYGTTPAYNVSLVDNLDNTFAFPTTYTVLSSPVSVNGLLITSPLFTGNGSNTNLLSSGNTLLANGVDTITVKVRFCSTDPEKQFNNIATVSANSLPNGQGSTGTDVSTDGLNPDPNGNGNPSDTDESAPTPFKGSDLNVIIPEGFNPNDVNGNQTWIIKGIESYPDNVVSVYNRWGNLVYQKEGYSNTDAWNGTANTNIPKFGANTMPQGTYYYVIEFKNTDQQPIKGFVVLQY